jgi:hypothetical protein
MWHHRVGDGSYQRVLDSGLRCTGTTRHPAVACESAEYLISDITGWTSEVTIRKIARRHLAGRTYGPKTDVSLCRTCRQQIGECDMEIERLVIEPRVNQAEKPLPEDRKQSQRQRKKKSGNPGLRHTNRGVPPIADPGPDDAGFHGVQRGGARYVDVAHGGAFRVLAGVVPDNDISGRKSAMARRPPNEGGGQQASISRTFDARHSGDRVEPL